MWLPPSGGVLRLDPVSWEPAPVDGAHPAGDATAVWTGATVLLWGGTLDGVSLGSGAAYDPAGQTWTPLSMEGAPSPRSAHSAVWTGREMLVFGGAVAETGEPGSARVLGDGGAYDPETDTWRPISTEGAPSARSVHAAAWTGTRMLVWGGFGYCNTGALYDPAHDQWEPMSTQGAPPGASAPNFAWTGEQLLVRGGAISDQYYLSQLGVFIP